MTEYHNPGHTEWFAPAAVKIRLAASGAKWLASPDRLNIARHVDLTQTNTFLEIAPQAGWRTLAALAQAKQKVTAMDKWSYGPAWKHLKNRVNFLMADAEDGLPFASNSFDHCVFMGAISYLGSARETLVEIHRVLKPGGLLFLSCNNAEGWAYQNGYVDPCMKTLWTLEQQITVLEAEHYQIKESGHWGFLPLSLADRSMMFLNKFIEIPHYKEQKVQQMGRHAGFAYTVAQTLVP